MLSCNLLPIFSQYFFLWEVCVLPIKCTVSCCYVLQCLIINTYTCHGCWLNYKTSDAVKKKEWKTYQRFNYYHFVEPAGRNISKTVYIVWKFSTSILSCGRKLSGEAASLHYWWFSGRYAILLRISRMMMKRMLRQTSERDEERVFLCWNSRTHQAAQQPTACIEPWASSSTRAPARTYCWRDEEISHQKVLLWLTLKDPWQDFLFVCSLISAGRRGQEKSEKSEREYSGKSVFREEVFLEGNVWICLHQLEWSSSSGSIVSLRYRCTV